MNNFQQDAGAPRDSGSIDKGECLSFSFKTKLRI